MWCSWNVYEIFRFMKSSCKAQKVHETWTLFMIWQPCAAHIFQTSISLLSSYQGDAGPFTPGRYLHIHSKENSACALTNYWFSTKKVWLLVHFHNCPFFCVNRDGQCLPHHWEQYCLVVYSEFSVLLSGIFFLNWSWWLVSDSFSIVTKI